MPGRVERERAAAREEEIAAIGEEDSKRLHGSMNDSGSSEDKRANKQPDHTPGNSDRDTAGATESADSSTSGSKRHASAGAGPAEPTATTVEREGKRATVTNEEGHEKPQGDTRRNDPETTVEQKPMKGSADRAKAHT
jgi:hypothetical protein